MPHSLPGLPYANDALEPHIDARTMEIHHTKHHQAYVNNLNGALEGSGLEDKELADILKDLNSVPDAKRAAVRNNGGGHYNHSLFWTIMSSDGGGEPEGELGDAINDSFGSFDNFKDTFSKAGMTRFGSGWAWLVVTGGTLVVGSTANQDNPVMGDAIAGISGTSILGLDVWEHAYYLNYQNRRPDYIAAWWNVVNWDEVSKNYSAAK